MITTNFRRNRLISRDMRKGNVRIKCDRYIPERILR